MVLFSFAYDEEKDEITFAGTIGVLDAARLLLNKILEAPKPQTKVEESEEVLTKEG